MSNSEQIRQMYESAARALVDELYLINPDMCSYTLKFFQGEEILGFSLELEESVGTVAYVLHTQGHSLASWSSYTDELTDWGSFSALDSGKALAREMHSIMEGMR